MLGVHQPAGDAVAHRVAEARHVEREAGVCARPASSTTIPHPSCEAGCTSIQALESSSRLRSSVTAPVNSTPVAGAGLQRRPLRAVTGDDEPAAAELRAHRLPHAQEEIEPLVGDEPAEREEHRLAAAHRRRLERLDAVSARR